MKKPLIFLFICMLALSAPSVSRAEGADTASETHQALVRMIEIIMERIGQLQAQLAAMIVESEHRSNESNTDEEQKEIREEDQEEVREEEVLSAPAIIQQAEPDLTSGCLKRDPKSRSNLPPACA